MRVDPLVPRAEKLTLVLEAIDAVTFQSEGGVKRRVCTHQGSNQEAT
jgi:hypothetical protein